MKDVKVSIIIPVYNAERYLKQCVDSVLHQTMQEIECILVNDGSIDNSYSICMDYKMHDSRVKVFSQENFGSAVARNRGIDMAIGKYISFVDADDWLDLQMIEKLFFYAEKYKCDISICNHSHIYSNGRCKIQPALEKGVWITESREDINIILRKFLCKGIKEYRPYVKMGYPWGRIYNAKVVKENRLHFPVGLHRTEDGIFNMYAIYFSKSICFTDETLYNYRILDTSISHKYYPEIVENTERDFNEVKKFSSYCMSKDNIFNKGITVRVTTWFHKYLAYKFFHKLYLEKYGYFRARKEVNQLLNNEPYISAYESVDFRLMTLTEKIFVFCVKHRFIEIVFLLVKIREAVNGVRRK